MEADLNYVDNKIKFIQDTLYVIGGKWKLPVLISIYHGNNRFRDLQRSIPRITKRVLSKELKDLEANHLITRTADENSPLAITYSVTAYSLSLTEVVDAMARWGAEHRGKITGKEIPNASPAEASTEPCSC